MVTAIVVVLVRLPEVPVMVTVAAPVVAVLLAVSVNVLVAVAGFVLNDAVTPLGKPDADRLTLPLKPFCGVTVIVLMPLVPCINVRPPGDVESAKFGGAVTLRLTVAVLVRLPEVPVMVTVLVPVVAVPLAVSVNVLVAVAGFGLNDAVTPLGRPDADRFTPPLNPFCGITVMVLVPLPPCVMPTLLGDAERLKLAGTPTVNGIGLLLIILGATHTDNGPDVALAGTLIVMDVGLQKLTGAGKPFKYTALPPWAAPKPVPAMTTWLPTGPIAVETPLIAGAGAAAELMDTLSNVAVASAELLLLLTASPTYTFCAILIVWLPPTWTQFTPSDDTKPLSVLPLRITFTQYGSVTDPVFA
jgi:hypothetical protein